MIPRLLGLLLRLELPYTFHAICSTGMRQSIVVIVTENLPVSREIHAPIRVFLFWRDIFFIVIVKDLTVTREIHSPITRLRWRLVLLLIFFLVAIIDLLIGNSVGTLGLRRLKHIFDLAHLVVQIFLAHLLLSGAQLLSDSRLNFKLASGWVKFPSDARFVLRLLVVLRASIEAISHLRRGHIL